MRTSILFILLFSLSIVVNAQVDLKKGLVAHYKLDGNAADSSTNSLHGTKNGTTNDSGHIGKPNTALKFNGSSDYVSVAHNNKLNLTGDKSFSIWYKIQSLSQKDFATIFFKQGDQTSGSFPHFGLQFTESSTYGVSRYKVVYFNGKNSTNKVVFSKEDYRNYLNKWVYIAVTYSTSDGYIRLFFNGNLSDSVNAPSFAPNTSTDPVEIGRGNKFNYAASYFNGLLDDFRIYDRALSQKEIDALYNERSVLYKNILKTVCQPDSVFAGGAYRHTSGAYYDTVNITGKCDSVIITQLTVNPSYYFPVTLTICEGNKVLLAGKLRTKAGIYYDSLKTNKSCDSIIQYTLLVNPSYYTANTIQICKGESQILGGIARSISGTYYDSLLTTNGCDSIIETTLIVNPTYQMLHTKQICNGESILLGGQQQATAGIYYDSLKTALNCDSIVVTTLTVNPTYTAKQSKTICQGDSIFLAGSYQTTNGTYTDVLFSSKGCDSVMVTQLTVNPSYMIQDTKTICQGDSIFIAGSYRFTGGIYYNNLTANKGCDSIVATTLIINPSYLLTLTISICNGDSALVYGIYRKIAGTYYDSSTTAKGCDSIVITHLIVTTNSNTVIQNANVLVAQEGNATYQWLDCNNNNLPIAGENSQLFVATANGSYAVEVTKNSCTVISNCVSVISLSDNSNRNFKQNLKIYPNPAKNWVKVELGKIYSKTTVSIYTLEGKKINTSTTFNSSIIELSTSEISAGVYLMEIIADGDRTFSKIIIED